LSQQQKRHSKTKGTKPSSAEQRSAAELEDTLKQLHPDLRETFVPLKRDNGVFSAEQANVVFGENPLPLHDLVQLAHKRKAAKRFQF
jgi:hypothetical protein